MMEHRKKIGVAFVMICYSIIIAVVFFFTGYKVAYDHIESAVYPPVPQTFYATTTRSL